MGQETGTLEGWVDTTVSMSLVAHSFLTVDIILSNVLEKKAGNTTFTMSGVSILATSRQPIVQLKIVLVSALFVDSSLNGLLIGLVSDALLLVGFGKSQLVTDAASRNAIYNTYHCSSTMALTIVQEGT